MKLEGKQEEEEVTSPRQKGPWQICFAIKNKIKFGEAGKSREIPYSKTHYNKGLGQEAAGGGGSRGGNRGAEDVVVLLSSSVAVSSAQPEKQFQAVAVPKPPGHT